MMRVWGGACCWALGELFQDFQVMGYGWGLNDFGMRK